MWHILICVKKLYVLQIERYLILLKKIMQTFQKIPGIFQFFYLIHIVLFLIIVSFNKANINFTLFSKMQLYLLECTSLTY